MSRRRFVAVAPFGVAGLVQFPAHAQATSVVNWDDPSERLETMIRIMGRTDGGVAIRWTRGVLSGIVEQETTQLLGISQQIFTRYQRQNDGGFAAVYLEIVYFSDLKTGSVLDKWANPYTGRTVAVPTQMLGPTHMKIPLSLRVINEPFAMPGILNTHWLEPLPIAGGDIMFNERIDSFVPPMTEGGAPLRFHEVFAFRASLEDIANKRRSHLPATVDKVNVISWRPWMDMPEVDGVTISRGAGRVIASFDELPTDLREKNAQFFPDVTQEIEDYLSI